MALCSLEDINVHLPQDKLVADSANTSKEQLDAQRIIFSKLSNTYTPALLATWATPATTPETIRAIGGRLVAALVYSRAFAAEVDGIPEYAQNLYDEALMMLQQIVNGDITLPGLSETPTSTGQFNADNFYPNADAPGPFFSMLDRF